jgi:hypothetical protein
MTRPRPARGHGSDPGHGSNPFGAVALVEMQQANYSTAPELQTPKSDDWSTRLPGTGRQRAVVRSDP